MMFSRLGTFFVVHFCVVLLVMLMVLFVMMRVFSMVMTVLSQVESVEKMQSILNTTMNTNTRK